MSIVENYYLKYKRIKDELQVLKESIDKLNLNERFSFLSEHLFIQEILKNGRHSRQGIFKDKENNLIFSKFPSYFGLVINHEETILNQLNEIKEFFPHIVGGYISLELPIRPERKVEEDLKLHSTNIFKKGLPTFMLLTEFIEGQQMSNIMDKYEKNNNIEDSIAALFLFIVMIIHILQKLYYFTHYDLHEENIRIRSCEKDSYFLYIVDDVKYLIPTYGMYPIFIDFGMTYIKQCNNKRLKCNMDNCNAGFTSYKFDIYHDLHHLFIPISKDFEDKRRCKNVFRFLQNNFIEFPVNMKTGWNSLPYDPVEKIFGKYFEDNDLVMKYYKKDIYTYINLLSSIIILPFKEKKIKLDFNEILKEFNLILEKIIKQLLSNELNNRLYLLKELIDAYHYSLNLDQKENKVIEFIKKFINRNKELFIDAREIIKDIDIKKLYISIYHIGVGLSDIYYFYDLKNQEKLLKYQSSTKMEILDIFKNIAQNMTPRFQLGNSDIIYICDINKKEFKSIKLKLDDNELEKVNNQAFLHKGNTLFEYINK